ncbi:MAG: PAC2 family protein [Candidatus Aenigmarchaeota archaeon]|nr:PAC2 family protein [Candidatus Aenigmarchaeota archaeon]
MLTQLYEEPDLREPYLLAAYPNIGGVGILAVEYLKRELNAKNFGIIKPDFHPTEISGRKIIELQKPEYKIPYEFYYWKNERAYNDLIIFIGKEQPHFSKNYEVTSHILDVAKDFRVKRIYTSTGAIAPIHHHQKPKILARVNDPSQIDYVKNFGLKLSTKLEYTVNKDDANLFLLGAAKERNMKGVCLLGMVPPYAIDLVNPKVSKAVLKILTKMLYFEADLTGIDELNRRIQPIMEESYEDAKEVVEITQMTRKLAEAMSTGFITYARPSESMYSDLERMKKDSSYRIKSPKERIEELFKEVERDKSKASKLKMELDRLGLFPQYEDRFLDLFRKRN